MSKHPRLAAAVAFGLTLTLGACGGDSSPPAPLARVYAAVYNLTDDADMSLVSGAVAAYSLSAGGDLTELGPMLVTPESGPCALAVTADGRALYVGDFHQTFYGYAIGADGALTYADHRDGMVGYVPYASLLADPTGQRLYVAEQEQSGLGNGVVATYGVDSPVAGFAAGDPATAEAGKWPQGLALRGGHLYTANTGNGTVGVYAVAADGSPSADGSLALAAGFQLAYLVVHPTRDYLYLVDGGGGVGVATIAADGSLENPRAYADEDGNQPSIAAADPLGRFIFTANYFSDTVSAYAAATDGALTFVGSYPCKNAQHVTVDPTGTFLLAASKGQYDRGASHTITVFRIDAATGALSPASSKNLGAGHEPNHLVAVGP
jgi:6-phosphogluconolactonase (cycloisomerase 2 family)